MRSAKRSFPRSLPGHRETAWPFHAAGFKCRSALASSCLPALSIVVFSRMQVRTSCKGRRAVMMIEHVIGRDQRHARRISEIRCSRARRRLSSPRYSRLAASHTPSARRALQLLESLSAIARLRTDTAASGPEAGLRKIPEGHRSVKMAFAFFRRALALGQQLAEPAIGGRSRG